MSELKKHRAQTTTELLEHTRRAWALLDEGVRRFDSGDEIGLDLVSQALRRLVCVGRGNSLLQRACLELQVPEPSIRVGGEPELPPGVHGKPGNSFLYGSLPERADSTMGSFIPMSEMMKRRVIIYREGVDVEEFTWDGLAALYANKMGPIHSDADLPVIVDRILQFEVAGGKVFSHALRNLGAAVGKGTAMMLITAGVLKGPPPEYPDAPNGLWVGAVQVFEGTTPDTLAPQEASLFDELGMRRDRRVR